MCMYSPRVGSRYVELGAVLQDIGKQIGIALLTVWRLRNHSGLAKDKRTELAVIKISARKNNNRYDTMKCQLQSMLATLQ